MLGEKDTVVIDVRNYYETVIGRIQPPEGGAEFLDPMMRNSREFPKWLNAPETKEKLKGKKVMMYCTGEFAANAPPRYSRRWSAPRTSSRRRESTTFAEASTDTSRRSQREGTGREETTCSTCAESKKRRRRRTTSWTMRRTDTAATRTAACVRSTGRCTRGSTCAATRSARCR